MKKKSIIIILVFSLLYMMCSSLIIVEAATKTAIIRFNANGGSVKTTSKKYVISKKYGTLPTATKKGYTATWYTAKSGGKKITIHSIVDKSRTLYAHWSLTKYKITYNLNGGTNNKNNPATYTMKTNTFSFKTPTKIGYIFKGWYKESTFKNKITSIKKGTTGNKSLYAKWTPISYKIVFNKNGGTGTMTDQTGLKYNKDYVLKANLFSKADYIFTGWNTKADGSGKSYANQESIKNLSSKDGSTVILYAQWKLETFNIDYHLDGGINNTDNPSLFTKSDEISLLNPSKKGYIFLGWYADSEFDNQIEKIEKGTSNDIELYAKWEKEIYNIKYHLDGGINNSDNVNTYTVTDEIILNSPTKEGYKFLGWYSDSSLNNKVEKIDVGTVGSIDLYTKWTQVYTIQFDANGGTYNGVESFTMEISLDSCNLPVPTRSGNNGFNGWYIIENGAVGNILMRDCSQLTPNMKLAAKWYHRSYRYIVYHLNGGINDTRNVFQLEFGQEADLFDPTKNGFTFLGWYTEPEFTNQITIVNSLQGSEVHLYAKWEEQEY